MIDHHGINRSIQWRHMSVMGSWITGQSNVCSTVFSSWHQRNHESFALLALCERNPTVTGGFLTKRHWCGKRFHDIGLSHDDVIKWKHFPRYCPFVRGIHRSPVHSPHKGQWRGALMFTLICARINGWVNNREAGDLRRYRTHYDVTVMHIFSTPHTFASWTEKPYFVSYTVCVSLLKTILFPNLCKVYRAVHPTKYVHGPRFVVFCFVVAMYW